MTKRNPYKHEQRHKNWKAKVLENDGIINDLSRENSEIIFKYIEDMEYGINISNESVKGGRSYIRLNTLRQIFVIALINKIDYLKQ